LSEDRHHEVVTTRAGFHAMRDRLAGEIMHPGVGPAAEAEALYVRQGRLAERLAGSGRALVLFDVGLGAGSNALAARALSERTTGRRLELVSFERDLGALELARAPEHAARFGLDGAPGAAARTLLERGIVETERTRWRLARGDLLEALPIERERADLVFWDPFSPAANPALWTVSAFRTLHAACAPGCTLFTYSASTRTRAALLLGGFAVGVGDAIGDKRETTSAALDAADLARPLDRRWLERWSRSTAALPDDAPPDAADRIRSHPQFR
jgi:queuine tRNA-ribosyltransferase